MVKYLHFLKNQISLITTYRFDLVWRWISNLFEIVVYFSLWSLTAGGNSSDLRRLLIYYILFYGILHNLQSSRVANWMGEDISSGQLNHYLTKPINFPLVTVIRTSALIVSRVVVPIILLFLGALIFPDYLAPANFASLFFFVLFGALGLFIWNLLMVLIGCLAFWLTEIKSLITVVDLVLSFVKGAFIPVYLFSDQMKTILELTPFNYLAAFPADIYQGLIGREQLLIGFMIAITWILILGFSSRWLYARGIRRYEAFG
ncbi:MAG: ABC-2 family transporter protein [Microgenomates group bacterium]